MTPAHEARPTANPAITTDAIRHLPLERLLGAIGDKTPAPGGGATASAAGALAAALGRMVVNYSVGRKSLVEHRPTLERAERALDRTASLLLDLAAEDAQAYALVNQLQRLPEGDPRREREMPAAVEAAIGAPAAVVAACADLLRLLEQIQPISNEHLRSDLAIAAILANAAARSAWWNVKINLPLLPEGPRREALRAQMLELLSVSGRRADAIERNCG